MSASVTFCVPLEVPSQNVTDRMHWRERHRLKREWLAMMLAIVGVRPHGPRRKMAVTITAYRKRLITDHANLVGGSKLVIDAVRDAKLIEDDSDAWACFAHVQHLASQRLNGAPCTVIQVEPFPVAPSDVG